MPLPESIKITEKNKKRDGRSAQENKQTVLEHMDRVSHATWGYMQVCIQMVCDPTICVVLNSDKLLSSLLLYFPLGCLQI